MKKIHCDCCAPEEQFAIKFVSEDNLYYFAELIKKCEDARIEKAIKEAIVEAGIDKTAVLKAVNELLKDGSLASKADVDAAKAEAVEDAVAEIERNLGAEIDNAIAERVPAAVDAALAGKDALTKTEAAATYATKAEMEAAADAADAKFVKLAGDTMTGALTAPKFITASGIEFY